MQIHGIAGYRDTHVKNGQTPPVEAYKNYLLRGNNSKRYWSYTEAKLHSFASKIRRAVIMRKQGESWEFISYTVDLHTQTLKKHVEFLPLELQP